MDLIKQRLTHLWLDQSTQPTPPYPGQDRFAHRMGVTFRKPTIVCGTMLLPGRYVFRMVDPCTEPNHVEIFNSDRTKLIAEITPVLDN